MNTKILQFTDLRIRKGRRYGKYNILLAPQHQHILCFLTLFACLIFHASLLLIDQDIPQYTIIYYNIPGFLYPWLTSFFPSILIIVNVNNRTISSAVRYYYYDGYYEQFL